MTLVTEYEVYPQPDGRSWQHVAIGRTDGPPPAHLTDSVLDLQRIESGEGMPSIDAGQDASGWVITATLWTDSATLTDEQRSLLDGSLSEAIASTRL